MQRALSLSLSLSLSPSQLFFKQMSYHINAQYDNLVEEKKKKGTVGYRGDGYSIRELINFAYVVGARQQNVKAMIFACAKLCGTGYGNSFLTSVLGTIIHSDKGFGCSTASWYLNNQLEAITKIVEKWSKDRKKAGSSGGWTLMWQCPEAMRLTFETAATVAMMWNSRTIINMQDVAAEYLLICPKKSPENTKKQQWTGLLGELPLILDGKSEVAHHTPAAISDIRNIDVKELDLLRWAHWTWMTATRASSMAKTCEPLITDLWERLTSEFKKRFKDDIRLLRCIRSMESLSDKIKKQSPGNYSSRRLIWIHAVMLLIMNGKANFESLEDLKSMTATAANEKQPEMKAHLAYGMSLIYSKKKPFNHRDFTIPNSVLTMDTERGAGGNTMNQLTKLGKDDSALLEALEKPDDEANYLKELIADMPDEEKAKTHGDGQSILNIDEEEFHRSTIKLVEEWFVTDDSKDPYEPLSVKIHVARRVAVLQEYVTRAIAAAAATTQQQQQKSAANETETDTTKKRKRVVTVDAEADDIDAAASRADFVDEDDAEEEEEEDEAPTEDIEE